MTRIGPRTRLAVFVRRSVDLLLLVLLAGAFTAVALGQVLPRLGYPVFVVRGPSMEPTIPLGSSLIATPVEPSDLRSGDVVSMRVGPDQAVFTHRVLRIVERDGAVWIETKGDANAEPDPAIVPASSVIGRVDQSLPAIGFLIALLSMPAGVLFAIAIAASLYSASWLLEAVELDRRESAELGAWSPGTHRAVRTVSQVSAMSLLRPRSAHAPPHRRIESPFDHPTWPALA